MNQIDYIILYILILYNSTNIIYTSFQKQAYKSNYNVLLSYLRSLKLKDEIIFWFHDWDQYVKSNVINVPVISI